jgi:hypothetical protein
MLRGWIPQRPPAGPEPAEQEQAEQEQAREGQGHGDKRDRGA